ncbi:MAG: metallophosphoesterase family protein [Planctomycetota bacterium]
MVKFTWIMIVLSMFLTANSEGQASGSDNPETPWSFIVTGDSRSSGENNGVNIEILGELAAEIAASDAEFVLFPGDLVDGNDGLEIMEIQFETWYNTIKPVYDAGIGVYPVRGNHDVARIERKSLWKRLTGYLRPGKNKADEPDEMSAWNKFFDYLPDNGPEGEKNLTYSFTHKNALIIGIDQYIKEKRLNQPWLDEQLAAKTSPHVFVFGHDPAFKAYNKSCLDDYSRKRDRFWASIAKARGRIYFCGHDHFYDHASADDDGNPANDIHQYIIGTAGAPPYDWKPLYDGKNGDYVVKNLYHTKKHGYVLVEIAGLNATVTWMQRQGRGIYKAADTWSYTAVSSRK